VKPFAWSYSALTRFENCPKQYYHLNVAKDVKDEGNEYSSEGNEIHAALYKRVVKGTPLPLPYRHFEPTAAIFADTPGEKHGEMKLALNREFEPTDYFAHDVWVRVVIDLCIVQDGRAVVIDWKTGKVKDDFSQLALSTAVLSQYMPEIDRFTIAYVWLKHSNVSQKDYTKEELISVWGEVIPRANRIEEARKTTNFPAKPSGLCKYCPVKACPEWRPRN
jgi:hypothetical protein